MRKLIIVLLIVLFPIKAFAAMTIYWHGGYYDGVGAGPEYNMIWGGIQWNGTENNVKMLCPIDCTIHNLYVETNINASGDIIYTGRKNGGDEALTATIANGTSSASDLIHSIDVARGDFLSLKATNAGAARVSIWSMQCDTDNDREPFVSVTTPDSPIANGTEYAPIWGNHIWSGSASTFNQTKAPVAFTAKMVYVKVDAAPGGATSREFDLMESGVDTGLGCTISGADTECSDAVSTDAIAANATLYWRCVSDAGVADAGRVYMAFVTDTGTNGESIIFGGSSNDIAANTTEDNYINRNNSTWGAALIGQLMAFETTIQDLYVYLTSDPGGADTVYVEIQGDGVGSGLDCTVNGGSQECSDAGQNTINAGEELTISYTSSATAATGDMLWSFVQYNAPAGGGPLPQVIENKKDIYIIMASLGSW